MTSQTQTQPTLKENSFEQEKTQLPGKNYLMQEVVDNFVGTGPIVR